MIGNTYDLTPERADQMARAAELSALCEAARWAFAHGWAGVEVVMDEHDVQEGDYITVADRDESGAVVPRRLEGEEARQYLAGRKAGAA